MRLTFDKGLVLGLGLSVGLLAVNAGLVYHNTRQLYDDANGVAHTHEVLDSLDDFLSTLKDAEIGQRGFLITGEPRYLKPYDDALATINEELERVKTLTEDNPRQQEHLSRLRELLRAKLNELTRTVVLRKEPGFDAARQVVLTDEGKKVMDAIRTLVEKMKQQERNLLRDRKRATDRAYFIAITTSNLATLLAVAAVGALVWLLQRHLVARTQAAAIVQQQRELLRATLTSIGDAVLTTDTQGRVNSLNPVAETLTGWKQEEASGRSLEEVFHVINERTGEPVENPVAKVLREGTVIGLANHTVLVARDGRRIPIDDSGAPIRGEKGTLVGVVLVFRDVTEARQAVEDRLHLAAIVESSDDAIISKNLDNIIISWNRGAERLYGYTAEEIVGKPLSILIPPGHADELPGIMERLKQGEQIDHCETVRLRKDGSRVDVSLTISPIKDAEGKIIGASKIARDITAAKRNKAALRLLADISKALAELLDVPSILQKVTALAVPHFADWCAVDLLEPDGSLRRVAAAPENPAQLERTHELHRRYSPDPTPPLGVWNVLRTGRSELLSEIPESLLVETSWDEELLLILREVGLRSYMGVPLTVRGKALGVITFLTAQSNRRFESADLRLAEDLAHRASIAVENARLYAELKEADRRKDEFLAMLAHELRNPLAPIHNALHILRMTPGDSSALEHARGVMERQVQHLVRLVDDLLDVSRITRGKIQLRHEPVDLAVVLSRAVELSRPLIEGNRHRLWVSPPPEPVRLVADPTRLEQIFANLLNNSAKYTERGGSIWLTAEHQGNEALVRIRDSGFGIPADMLPHVFDLFMQADRTLDRSQGGLGIGLTLARRLVEMHGGSITAHSEGPGKGSEFVVRLPLSQEGFLQADTEAPPPAEASSYGPSALRILVVDDNKDAADCVATLLRIWGHDVRTAHEGYSAVKAAHTYRPHVVFLDIGLPGLDGYEVARELRRDGGEERILLVALTGYGQDEDRRRSQQAGFDHHLIKPVDPSTLKELLAGLHPSSA